MTPVDVLRAELAHLRSRRPGCQQPDCSVCARNKRDDAEADAALATVESRLERLAELESAHGLGSP